MNTLTHLLSCALLSLTLSAQPYVSYLTGSDTDLAAEATGGVCLMGGATENDNAMRWFLRRAGGGDVVVLRASGADGYNDYMYSELGVELNSVTTIVFFSGLAADDPYILEKIAGAEAIWFAGGDQYDYIRYWRGTAVDSLINVGLRERGLAIGGTSAGMAILGGHYYSARNGSVQSPDALADPFDADVTVDTTGFLNVAWLGDVTTDTHYGERDRQGRHAVFLARALTDYGAPAYGIACDEYTAVCIDPAGRASVYGSFPEEDDNAYFLRVNCGGTDNRPEQLTAGQPLTWDRDGKALKVYHVRGTEAGSNYFNLSDWTTGEGGEWEDWSVREGNLRIEGGEAPICATTSVNESVEAGKLSVWPNPVATQLHIDTPLELSGIELYDGVGRLVLRQPITGTDRQIDVTELGPGLYTLRCLENGGKVHAIKVRKR